MIKKQTDELVYTLIEGCVNNDRRSQKELYRIFYAQSFSICSRYAKNKEDAISILNEGFYKIFSNIKQYNPQKPFGAWLHRIMTHASIDFYRSSMRWSEHHVEMEISREENIKTENVLDELQYKDLLKMVQSLSPSYRAVFNLFAIEGYSHEEIAQMLNISIGTSKSNLFKARAILSELINRANMSISYTSPNIERMANEK